MSRRLATILGVAAVVLGLAVLVGVVGSASHDDPGGSRGEPRVVRHLDVQRGHTVIPPASPPKHVAIPARIEVPAIGVRAPIIKLGLNRDRTLEVPEDFRDTGWWSGGPRPGERGPAVIVGHIDSHTGPAVFYRLRDLDPGDKIVVVRRDGTRARFTVEGSEQYPKDDFPTARVYGRTKRPTLRLITCGGDFDQSTGHYVDNTVVYARATT